MAKINDEIQAAAVQFATQVIAALRGATLEDLMAFTGQPPSDGRLALRPGRSANGAMARPPRKRNWPSCSLSGCTNRYYPASGKKHLCYDHFLEAGGKHPSKKK